jgi:lysophospholipase L1-like esterase
VFFGPFYSTLPPTPIRREPTDVIVTVPEAVRPRLESLPSDRASALACHPRVCRVVLRHGVVHLHGVEGAVRPPKPEEKPRLTMLAYGTSITHGAAATAAHLSYVAQTAWRLGTDLLNLGVGGACRAEKAFADHIAERRDWDFATLALSVNMIGAGFTGAQFRERVRYLIDRITGANPTKPVFCISIYPCFRDWVRTPGEAATTDEFRRILAEVVRDAGAPDLHFVPGPEILTDISGLTADMIHPFDFGMIEMGRNLAERIAPVLDRVKRSNTVRAGR